MKAAKRKTFWLLWIASAILLSLPALASGVDVSHAKTRAELSAENGQFSVEPSTFYLGKHVENYDPFRGTASDSPVAPNSAARSLQLPLKGNLSVHVLGETDWAGKIRLRNGLSWAQQRETLIHEGVHRFFTAKNGPLVGFRQWLTKQGYTKSQFLRGVEEMLAQGYARYRVSGSFGKAIGEGLAFPFTNGYVTPGRFFLEGGVAVGGTIYVGWWLQDWLFDE